MILKKKVASLSEVPQRFRKFYKKIGDYWVTEVTEVADSDGGESGGDDDDSFSAGITDDDGDAEEPSRGSDRDRAKLKEMRNNNIRLMKQIKELKDRLDGVDTERMAAGEQALETVRNAELRELIRKGDYNGALEHNAKLLREAHQKEIKKLQDQLAAATSQVSKLRNDNRSTKIETQLRREAAKLKIKFADGADADVLTRALSIFDLDENGNIVAFEGQGDERAEKVNGEGKTYGFSDFFSELTESASFLLAGASGADVRSGENGARRRPGGPGTLSVDANDVKGFGSNIEDIAAGKVKVRMGTGNTR